LDFEDGVDTLGRWMAHHLAELMDQVKKGATVAERAEARKSTVETILRVWEHRASLPERAYPLAPYQNVLAVLHKLRPGANPFLRFRLGDRDVDQLAADLFDSVSRLILALLLVKAPSNKKSSKTDKIAGKSLSKEERQILVTIESWSQLILPNPVNTNSRKTREGIHAPRDEGLRLKDVILTLIDATDKTLEDLHKEISSDKRDSSEELRTGRL